MTDETIEEGIKRLIERHVRFYAELDGESPRAAAILAAAHFEDILGDAIDSKFVRLNRKVRDRIFTGYGPLSTFAAKIDIAFALGFYGMKTRKALLVAKRVRNKFAHASEPIDFENPEIASDCSKLTPQNLSDPENSRERYIRYLKEIEDSLEHVMASDVILDDSQIEPLP